MKDSELKTRASQAESWAVSYRRALHQVPEEGTKESETQKIIMKALDEIGIPFKTDGTAVIGLIRGAEGGRTVALRADIDALPLTEPEGLPFCSRHPGWMHACGHDIHTAMLLGAARVLNAARGELHGNVKLLFQPAEENVGGAQPMVKAGWLENPQVDEVFGIHVQPRMPVGMVETFPGPMNAACDEIDMVVRGRGGHGAYPEGAVDAIVIAAHVIDALQTLISREISPVQPAVITLGTISGGQARNVICDSVSISGTLRTMSPDMREFLHRRLPELARGIAQAMRGDVEMTITDGYCPLINHEASSALVHAVAARLMGAENAVSRLVPSMGGDDFGYFIEHTPGAYYNIGCSAPGTIDPAPLHSARFLADEGCIRVGIEMHVGTVLAALARAQE